MYLQISEGRRERGRGWRGERGGVRREKGREKGGERREERKGGGGREGEIGGE
jgi:hypothetical protein